MEKITYYALVDDYSNRENPSSVVRRIESGDGQDDQQFGYDLEWTHSPTLYAYERGNMDNQLFEISEDEANQIVERIRRSVTGEG